MTGRIALGLRLLPILIVLALAACGGGGKTTATTQTTAPPPGQTMTLRVYFLRNGKVQPVAREVPRTKAVASAAFRALLLGPTQAEERLGLTEAIPSTFQAVGLTDGVLDLGKTTPLTRAALAQIVYTLTQFPTVHAVQLNGKRYTRADFEDFTPAILVESPLPFETVRSPLRARGTANTFEATFEYDLTDPEGKIVAHHFVTATSGSGTRGTFDFTVPFTTDRSGLGELIVYEISAEDGSRIHLVEIPIRLAR